MYLLLLLRIREYSYLSFTPAAARPFYSSRATPAHLAGDVVPWVDTELLAVVLVVAHPRLHRGGVLAVALEGAVEDPDSGAEPLRWHHLVRVGHPEPERRLE